MANALNEAKKWRKKDTFDGPAWVKGDVELLLFAPRTYGDAYVVGTRSGEKFLDEKYDTIQSAKRDLKRLMERY